ncbi:LIM and calponin homology domains-containing protein 1 isoform X3 [Triplophysa dalaica]|uniref:LIM and calponin homology domains-containing protein 1 isoform X3 n=1 Tax=Triplophysa dalaica TaxID=1582913 RepID=UPI0024DFD6D9|nr:LIM and calponin homology domains-containing protein 1 isoform X3 [Triplophysa dalaica]
MASPGLDAGLHIALQPHHHSEPATKPSVSEAQRWIEAVTGRSFGEKDFRGGLDNGILLCELLSSIRPGLVKKINRLPTPVAALDNVVLFLKGCKELGLRTSQLFDPGDLQDPSIRTKIGQDSKSKLKRILITLYWLGRAANSIATYSGPTLDLHEFEGLLSQMKKEAEDRDSPNCSIRDSGYIDCWESEHSDSPSPRYAPDDSFDSLDSIGSHSCKKPSPDGLLACGYSDDHGSDSECDTPQRKMPDVDKDDMLVRRTSCCEQRTAVPFNQYLPNRSNQTSYLPAAERYPRVEREENRRSWSNATSPVGGERPFRSISMVDMRSEEDFLPPHCQVRHQLIHNQCNNMTEDDDHWQDDLARWKSRRRSVSQDLIKKEEERKMRERLMSGDKRRKSIKTYREIVEEKEHRERDLHEAYRNARTPKEASAVLQHYSQRFTISEAILERLKLNKLLERSVSADPNRHSSLADCPNMSSNLLQYLRQQSLPTPKFTSTVEARVTGFMGDVENVVGPAYSLDPIQYRQSRNGSAGTDKVDEAVRVNGVRDDDVHSIDEEERGGPERHRGEDSLQFFPSPSQDTEIRQTDASGVSSTVMTEIEGEIIPLTGGVSISPEVSETKTDVADTTDVNRLQSEENAIHTDAYAAQLKNSAMESQQKSTNESDKCIHEYNRTTPMCQVPTTEMAEQADGNGPPTVLNLMKHAEHFSWSPEEERKRQERWQREQERMLQEKYRREQEKLKREWEQAQKEVEEEERRYHEEEQKILEETVTPLTPYKSITHSPLGITNSITHSQPEQVRQQKALETQSSEVCRQGENIIGDAAQRQMSLQMTVSSPPQGHGSVDHFYGQRGPEDKNIEKPTTLQSDHDVPPSYRQQSQQTETWKSTSQTKPGGRKRVEPCMWLSILRSGSIEKNVSNSSTSPSLTGTQPPPSPNRSVSGRKLCSSCGNPLGKGAAMIIETLSLYFHIQCFKCGICKGQLGDTSTGTDVRIRNGLLNCHQCYIRSRSAGQPTTL